MTHEIDWDELERLGEIQSNDRAFRDLDRTLVPGEGDNPVAFVIGDAPSAQEVMQRRPFMGPAGMVQRQLLSFAGLWASKQPDGAQANCWLTPAVKFRPPRNRKPFWIEIRAARPYLMREWQAVGRPQLIIPIGGTALAMVASRQLSITKVAGQPIERPAPLGQAGKTYVWPMLPVRYGLRNPAMQELIERDWARLAEWMKRAHDS
jgi:uracil-DNA glycosylase family 4